MNQKLWRILSVAFVCVFFVGGAFSGSFGCAEEVKEPDCVHSGDCDRGSQTCVDGECKELGDIDDPCPNGDIDCLRNSADTGKKLVCYKKKCAEACSTYLDCDHENGESCDTTTGICISTKSDSGTPEALPGKKLGEDCGTGIKCEDSLACIKLANQSRGKCWKSCKKDTDCSDGRACSGGYCVTYGDKCEFGTDGKLRTACWAGLTCALEGTVEGVCLRTCNDNAECSSGYTCSEKDGKKYCQSPKDQAGAGQPCGDLNGKQVGCVTGTSCLPERLNSKKSICTKKCAKDADCTYPRFCQAGSCILGSNAGSAKMNDTCKVSANATEAERCDAGLYCLVYAQDKPGKCYRSCRDPRAPACPAEVPDCVAISTSAKICTKKCSDPKGCPASAPQCAKIGQSPSICVHNK